MSFLDIAGALLKEGTKGDAVKALQGALEQAGVTTGTADGIFGPKTKAAVVALQQKAGLNTDGVVGPMTAGALKKLAAAAVGGKGPTNAQTAKKAAQDIASRVGGLFGGDD